ncbi:MAG: hypothetical protein R6V47_01350, partial [Candidatus Delongbacteria bacterium]
VEAVQRQCGTSFSFCDAEEKAYLKDVEKLISKKIPVIDEHHYPLIDHNPVKTVNNNRNNNRSRPFFKKKFA